MRNNLIDSNFLYYFHKGIATSLYDIIGSHLVYDDSNNVIGTEFMLYAPNAVKVSIMGSFNGYSEDTDYLKSLGNGFWYLYFDKDLSFNEYKYVLFLGDGRKLYKSDPYAFFSSLRPSTNSVVYEINGYKWNDDLYQYSKKKTYDKPMNIYEIHFGSWKRKSMEENGYYNYRELADQLIPYLIEHNYTHVELLPIYEHPLDASWGYQGTGYFSASSRYGEPKDLMYFVDKMHQAQIGVIFDWVPGHVCKDAHGLYMFDGTPLYDYEKTEDRENYEWGTANLDLGKNITRSFLFSNALFYMRKYHADGFRVDAVSNIIYYLGNKDRGVNEGACNFIRELSKLIFKEDDRVLLIAEDSSDFQGVTKPVDMGGLGFNYKWDMGWMNDTLKYFKLDPIYRKYHHNQLTFSMAYFYSEQFLLPFSHDEVVHLKKSILDKMPGDYWQKFANFRLLMGYMLTHPGKKLTIMGTEIAQFSEWAFERELDWNLLDFDAHYKANQYIKDLNKLYIKEKSLYELDYSYDGFKWIDADNSEQSIFIYSRYAKNKNNHLVIIMNCTPNTYHNYRIGVPSELNYREILNSDDVKYYGSGQINKKLLKNQNEKMHGFNNSITLTIPPLGIVILKASKAKK